MVTTLKKVIYLSVKGDSLTTVCLSALKLKKVDKVEVSLKKSHAIVLTLNCTDLNHVCLNCAVCVKHILETQYVEEILSLYVL